ncbi:hypothetical protein CTRC342_01185 [Chlamydia trachomatis RC-F(s)/342]|nr:hypothetical protein CTRC342_01185 [Chlamydia trachomatis RC-F(s)/342]
MLNSPFFLLSVKTGKKLYRNIFLKKSKSHLQADIRPFISKTEGMIRIKLCLAIVPESIEKPFLL